MQPSYEGKRVFVMGGMGFIGLNLVRRLLWSGAQVTILTRSISPFSQKSLQSFDGSAAVRIIQCDMLETDCYRDALLQQDIIFNLAGQSGASQSILQAHNDMKSNVEGNLMLLETIRQADSPPRVVFISSRLVYGATHNSRVNEEHPLEPTSIYGLHKLTVEHYYRLYHMQHDVPFVVLRLTNPFGPYQHPERTRYGVVNMFILKAIRDEKIVIFGDGLQKRDYIYIEDVVNALLLVGQSSHASQQIYNLAYGESISLIDMAQKIVEVAGSGSIEHVPWPTVYRRVETGDFFCDNGRIQQSIGWSPEYDMDAGLKATIHTYRVLLADSEYMK